LQSVRQNAHEENRDSNMRIVVVWSPCCALITTSRACLLLYQVRFPHPNICLQNWHCAHIQFLISISRAFSSLGVCYVAFGFYFSSIRWFHLMCLQLMLATSTDAIGCPESWQHVIGSDVQEDKQWLQMEEAPGSSMTWKLVNKVVGR